MAANDPHLLHANHRARMQARVDRDGLDSLAEHEALEYLLFFAIPRQDTNALAHRLIGHFGSFCRVLEAEPAELMKVEGIGPQSARLISSVTKFARYYQRCKRDRRSPLDSAQAAMDYVKPLFYDLSSEVLYLILLDDSCRPLQELRVAEGVPDRVSIDVRKLMREVARASATRGILAHNHPFGIAVPSERDITTTFSLMQALGPLGFTIVDHIIVADGDACSMASRGLLPGYTPQSGILDAASR